MQIPMSPVKMCWNTLGGILLEVESSRSDGVDRWPSIRLGRWERSDSEGRVRRSLERGWWRALV